MDKHTHGSALVLVLILTSLMSVIAFVAIKQTVWIHALQRSIEQQERVFCFAKGAFDCAISRGKAEFDQICKNKKPIIGIVRYENSVAHLYIEPQEQKLIIMSKFGIETDSYCNVRATLTKDDQGIFHISEFSKMNL